MNIASVVVALTAVAGAVAVVLELGAPASVADPRPADQAGESTTISGRVTGAEGVGGAVVVEDGRRTWRVPIGEDGGFELAPNASQSHLRLSADVPGKRSLGRDDLGVVIDAMRPSVEAVEIAVVEPATVRGRVDSAYRRVHLRLRYETDGSGARDYDARALQMLAGESFELTDLPPGRALVVVERSGAIGSSSRVLDLGPGVTIDVGTLVVTRGGTIVGRALDGDKPVVGGSISAIQDAATVIRTETNAAGIYQLRGLAELETVVELRIAGRSVLSSPVVPTIDADTVVTLDLNADARDTGTESADPEAR